MTPSHAVESPAAVVPWFSRASIGVHLARLRGWAPFAYLVTALPTVLFLTVLTPPFQVPDEPNHFRRAAAILNGTIVGQRSTTPGQSGAVLPKSVSQVADSFMYLSGRPELKYSAESMQQALATHWHRSDKGYSDFSNIAIYPPFFYLPTVAALSVGRSLDWSVMNSYRLARSVNGIAAVLLASAAIGLAGRGRSLLFVILSLPTALDLFASVSQDALLIAGTGLAVALCSCAAERPEGRTWPERLIASILFGAAMAARPPYFVFSAALAMPLPARHGSPVLSSLARRLWPVALGLAIGIGWIVFGAAPAQVPMRIDGGVSIPDQISAMVRHPMLFPSVLWNTLSRDFVRDLAEAIGVLGWSDGPLPSAYHVIAGAALVVGASLASGWRERFPARLWGCAIAAAMVMAFVGVYGALYLSWTPVGSDWVEGFQGRYILPIATLAVVALPAATARRSDAPDAADARLDVLRSFGWVSLFAFAAVSDLWLPFTVFERYYA